MKAFLFLLVCLPLFTQAGIKVMNGTTTLGVMNTLKCDGTTVVCTKTGVTASVASSGAVSSVSVANGSAAAPSMNFSTNTDTGFYQAGLGTVAVSVEGTLAHSIGLGGKNFYPTTVTTTGTTGAQTINKITGTVNFAAAATAVVVTNSLVTTASMCFAVLRTADSTCRLANVVPGAGSFTITMTAGCNAETSVGFFCIN